MKKKLVAAAAAGVVLASSGALAAAPAFAWTDNVETHKGLVLPSQISLSKTDAATGAPLDGAVFEVPIMRPGSTYVGIGWDEGTTDMRGVASIGARTSDPWSTWNLAPITVSDPDEDAWVAEQVRRANLAADARDAARAEALAPFADFDANAARGAVAAWNAFRAAHNLDALESDASAKDSERQRLADEIIALQNAGQPVPAELVAEHATAREAAEAAAQAVADALAQTDASGQTGTALREAATSAAQRLAAYEAAVANVDATLPVIARITADDVDRSAFRNTSAAFLESYNAQISNWLAQETCNEKYGVPTTPIDTVNDAGITWDMFRVATCDGVAYLPVGAIRAQSITEVGAPEGYVLDSTVHEIALKGEGRFGFDGTEVKVTSDGQTQAVRFNLTNERAPEPEVPPVTPTPTPPAPEVPTPTPSAPTPTPTASATPTPTPSASAKPSGTLAYTGGSAEPAIWAGVIGGIAALAGGALLLARRKRA